MKITDLKVHCCRMPLTPLERGGIAPYQLSYRIATHVDRYFTEVVTDSGVTGWGEGELTLSPDAMRAFYAHDLKPALLGVDPREINRIRGIFRQTTFKKYLNEQVFLAPVETGCWDNPGQIREPAPVRTARREAARSRALRVPRRRVAAR